jgi:hypothetical protein
MYTDLTGAFPVRSFKNMIYIFVAYIYDLNAIIVRPMVLYNMVLTHTLTAPPRYNFIEPDKDRHECPATRSSKPPR